ncbi:hypothetical protein GTW51_06260 [Aurantimonas aggregata]|uniref:Uncharacterized protein n=1 Tax=Aurantimonas aggregata TaxID=2047720 RepID=A0A6L9MFF3_9HYPH|nr:hypothetical protein [Aurantimonas aggregata]NDV86302.1 hypothetical protein [Aurantimonas aggregata]
MSHDDDRQLAGEIEEALRALGIANPRFNDDRRVEPFVRELRGGEMKSAGASGSGQQDIDSEI